MTETEHKSDSELTINKIIPNSPTQVSYGMSIVRIWEKTDCTIMAPHCIWVNIGSGNDLHSGAPFTNMV